MEIQGAPDRIIKINDKDYLYFGGTSYLGITTNRKFQKLLAENIAKWGTSYGSSRNSNITLSVYNAFENKMAKNLETESAAVVTSGTLAGKMVIDLLSKSKTKFFHYPKTHPAILATNSLPLFVDDKLHSELVNAVEEEVVITVDAILGLEVKSTLFSFLDAISLSKRVTLVIDESHSLGVLGNSYNGISSSISNKIISKKIVVSSLGKALGIPGGIIASNAEFINAIKSESIFISSSAAIPAFLETYLQADEIYKLQRVELFKNINYISKQIAQLSDLIFDKNYPAIYSNNAVLYKKLLAKGIVISHFNYPTYKQAMNRIVITANHTIADLDFLINALK